LVTYALLIANPLFDELLEQFWVFADFFKACEFSH
jgi:hypothetical protein